MRSKPALAVMCGVPTLVLIQSQFAFVLAFGAAGFASMASPTAGYLGLMIGAFALLADLGLFVWTLVLFVAHAWRSPAARPNRWAWTALLLLAGPFGPIIYWCAVVNRDRTRRPAF